MLIKIMSILLLILKNRDLLMGLVRLIVVEESFLFLRTMIFIRILDGLIMLMKIGLLIVIRVLLKLVQSIPIFKERIL